MSRDIIVKSGWMYRQKTVFQKKWKHKWMVLYQDGRVSFRNDSSTQKQGNYWDLRRDCMYIWDEKQCQHVLPPSQSSSACIFELLFVGNKRLTLCAPAELEAQPATQGRPRQKHKRRVSWNDNITMIS